VSAERCERDRGEDGGEGIVIVTSEPVGFAHTASANYAVSSGAEATGLSAVMPVRLVLRRRSAVVPWRLSNNDECSECRSSRIPPPSRLTKKMVT